MSSTFRSNQVSQTDTSISVPDLGKSITIFINEGHPETTASFTVPENLLIEKSQYFKDLCNIKPAGNHNNIRTVKLQDVDVEAFNFYIYWTCKDRLAFNARMDYDPGHMDAGLAFPLLKTLSTLWLLGARLAESKFRNLVMDVMIDVIEWLDPLSADFTAAFPPELTTLIWSTVTTQDRAIRRLVIDFYAYMVSPTSMERHWNDVHPGFVKDLTMRSLDFSQKGGRNIHTALHELCFYHEHDQHDKQCESPKRSWESVLSSMAPQT